MSRTRFCSHENTKIDETTLAIVTMANNAAILRDTMCGKPYPESSSTNLYEEFLCGICQELMLQPVCCVEGHSWCQSCIQEWLDLNETCPVDRQPLVSSTLARNRPLETVIIHHIYIFIYECINANISTNFV
jgi:hypothetical protein